MFDQESCFICGTTHTAAPRDPKLVHQKCPRCGEFKLTIRVASNIGLQPPKDRVKISGWVSDQNRDGTGPTISVDVLERVSARSLPTFAERADRLLLEAVRGQKKLGEGLNITEPRFVAATDSQNAAEVNFLSRFFALGLGHQVIWTCRKDDMQDLHFDIRQYNTIDWDNPKDLATRLQHRIEATVGKGPKTVLNT